MTVWMLIWGELLLMLIGLLSVFRPEWVGVELYWTAWKGIFIPRVQKAVNPYYMRQIQIVGVGVLLSCVALLCVYLWPIL